MCTEITTPKRVAFEPFVAVTTYVFVAVVVVGLPLITPVVAFMLKPTGNDGLTEYPVGVPVIVGDKGVIAEVEI